MNNISGKTVIITGASSGIGQATALLLAQKGENVVIAARRKDRLEQVESQIKAKNGQALVVQTDVTKRAEADRLIQKAMDQFKRVDVLVNNAGIMSIAPMKLVHVEEWERMIDINVKGLLYCVAAALPIFNQQESGHFINISSVAGLRVSTGGAVYAGTKFAVRAISDGIRREVGSHIRTTVIYPGAIQSELLNGTSDPLSHERLEKSRQIAVSPDCIARSIAFAIEQPAEVDVNEIVIRPTAQEN